MIGETGTFIPNPKSELKSKLVKPADIAELYKVPDYRAESISGALMRKNEKDSSRMVKQVNVEEIPMTTQQKFAACKDDTCTSTVRYDDSGADAMLDKFGKRHPDDLVDMYRQNEKA